jgi:hypothetical protein
MFEIDWLIWCSNLLFNKKFNGIYMHEIIAYRSLYVQGITKKQIYFLFGRIYLTYTWIKSYIAKSRLKKLLAFRKVYLKPIVTMQNLRINV